MRLRTFHRWHGLAMSVIVLMAATSGLLHTWMARSQPPPPPAQPAGEVALATVTVPVASLPGPAAGVILRQIGDQPWWQVLPAGGGLPRWVDARTGTEDPTADARYAAHIAHQALAGKKVQQAGFLTAYDQEYIAIFRILPVYRFNADDAAHTRVYVSTMTGSVTRLTDDAKQFEATTFSLLHKWMFIRNRTVRDWTLMGAMTGLVGLALSGVVLFVRTRRRSRSAVPSRPEAI